MALNQIALSFLLLIVSASALAQETTTAFDTRTPTARSPGNNNGAVVDPTENVKELVRAEKQRQDDLRLAAEKLFASQLAASDKLSELRSVHDKELLRATTDKLESDAKLRADYSDKIAATEKARVDAIRLVDTGAVAIANERATATANTLAKTVTDTAQALSTQVTRNAEDLRLLVKTTADEQTRNLQQQFTAVQNQFTGLSTRITALEQTGAEGAGRQKFKDPTVDAALAEIKRLGDVVTANTGKSEGISATVAMLLTLGALFLAAFGIGVTLMLRARPADRLKH